MGHQGDKYVESVNFPMGEPDRPWKPCLLSGETPDPQGRPTHHDAKLTTMLNQQGHPTYHDTAHRSLGCSPDGSVKMKGGQAKNIRWDGCPRPSVLLKLRKTNNLTAKLKPFRMLSPV